MSHHETRNTTAVLAFCSTCNKKTMHRVCDRRRGTCMEPHADGLSKKQEQARKALEKKAQNPKLGF